MHRRGRSSVASKSSVGSSMAADPTSDESSEVETDSSARSPSHERVRVKPAINHRRKKRKRLSRPAVENIIDGFAICSFETIQDLTCFLEKKTLIEPCSKSSSSESDYEPVRPSSVKSSDTVSLSSSPKRDWKHRQTTKFIASRTEFHELTDHSLSPKSFSSCNKTVSKMKFKQDISQLDNQLTTTSVSLSSLSMKNQRSKEEESGKRDSLNCAPFTFVSSTNLPKEGNQCNSPAIDTTVSPFIGLCNALSKHDGPPVSVTDAESEASVVLVKEEQKESRWSTMPSSDWLNSFPPVGDKKKSDSAEKEHCETAEAKKSVENIQTLLVRSDDLVAKWPVIKEMQNLLKAENSSPKSGLHASRGRPLSPLASESHSSSLDKFRTFQDNDLRHNLDPTGISSKAKADTDTLLNSKSNFLRKRLDSDNSLSNPRNADASNDSRSSSAKGRIRDGSSGASKGSSSAALTLTAADIKRECASPGSIRISSRQSSSRSSASHRKSSLPPPQPLGNGDFSSVYLGDRSLRSPLAAHPAHYLNGPPIQPAAFSLGSLSIPPGLFPSSLPHLPVPGLHPSSAFVGSSAMGLHSSLLASAPCMLNPVTTNPDLFQVQQELNARFLQDHCLLPLGLPPIPLTLRTEMHQHQHLHHHQHVVPAPYFPSIPGSFSMASHPLSMLQTMGPSGLDLVNHSQTLSDFAERERLCKIRASMNLSDGFLPPSYASLFSGVLPNGLTSNMHGAFTINESKPPSMSASHLLRSLRNDQQVVLPSSVPTAPTAKKRGRWCAAHVEIAFRICYHKQQQQRQTHLDAGRHHVVPSSVHHFPRVMGSDIPAVSLHQPQLHFGVSSFLRPTPQSLPPADASGLSSSSSSLSSSAPFISRPRLLHGQPGDVSTKSEEKPALEMRRGGSFSFSSASSALIHSGVDSVSLHFAEQERKRRLHERERENEEQNDKKMRIDASVASELRLRPVKSERNSSPRIPFTDNKSSLTSRNGPAPDVARIRQPSESRSPFLSSSDRSSRSTIESSKKRGHLAMPLSIDTQVVDYPSSTAPGLALHPPHNRLDSATDQNTQLPTNPDRLKLVEDDQLHRDRLAQSYYAQSVLIHDADRFRGLIPLSRSGLGLSLNGLSKPDQDSFKPYANLNSSLSRLDAAKSVGNIFKSPDVVFKPNPDGLLIVTSHTGGTRSSFPVDSSGGGGSIAGLPPPPLVRLDHGLVSYKRPGPYGSMTDFSSNLCGLPGGAADSSGLGLPFR